MVLLVLEYLGNTAVLTKFGQLNKTCYRLSRDNSLWRRRMHLHFPEIAYVSAARTFVLRIIQRERTSESLGELVSSLPRRVRVGMDTKHCDVFLT